MKNMHAFAVSLQLLKERIWDDLPTPSLLPKLTMALMFCLTAYLVPGQIAAWNFYSQDNIATYAATTYDANLVPGSYKDIMRGAAASSSTGANSFRTTGFKNDGVDVTNTDYFQITLSAIEGHEISLSTIDANFDGTSSFYATPGVTSQFAYSLDGTTFSLIGSPVQSTSLTMAQIDLSGIASLQDVHAGTTITIRYYASGQTTSGGWGFYSSASGINGLAVGGYVTPIGATTYNTDYFKSRQDGDWATAATWESSTDNITWHIATKPPTKDASAIAILNTHTVTISSSVSLDQTIVDGILELQTGGILNINDGDLDDLSISSNGIFRITSANSYAISVAQSSGAVININTGGKITIGDGSSSIGSGYENLATSTINVWNGGAIYEYNSNTAFAASNLTYFPNAGSKVPIFRVTKVNGTPGGGPTVINGILEVNSSFTFSGGSDKTFRNGIRGNATLTQSNTANNRFFITAPNAILDGTSLQMILSSPLNLSSSTSVPVGASVTISGGNINNSSSSGTFTIDGLLDMTEQQITNTNGTVVVNGTYRTAKSGGFSSGSSYTNSSIPSGNITLNPASAIELYSLNNQGLNSRPDFANLIFSGGGIKTPGSSFDASGTIIIKDNAVFNCTNHNIGGAQTNLIMTDNSRLIVGTTSTQPKMEGTYSLSGGTIEFANNDPSFQSIRSISEGYNNIEVSGKNVRNSNGNINLNPGGSFTITPTGIFTINDEAITGSSGEQTLTIQSGGIFNCGSSLGFYGALAGTKSPSVRDNIENIILEPGSTINYSRSDPPLTTGHQMITTIGTSGTIPYQNLIVSGNGNKTAPAGTLEIRGNLTKSGSAVFMHNDGAVLLNGSAEQTYSSTPPQMVFNNFINNNVIGLNINDGLSVYRELLLKDNSRTNIHADITLLSDNNSTANIAPIAAGSVINYHEGLFIAERYIPNHPKAWQFLSVPTKGSTIKESWMEGNIPDGNTNPGHGTLITSNRATWSADGFDLFSRGGPSMKIFDPLSNSWKGVTATSNLIDNQNGYLLFVRGDRGTHFGDPVTATTMRTRGKIYAPGIEAPKPVTVPANSFQSISNPYASAIDFDEVFSLSPGINYAYYIWDPRLTTYPSAYGLGAYRTISGNASAPSGDNYTDGNIPPIQSGQAFFVTNPTAVDHTVNFDEGVKVSGSRNIFRYSSIEEPKAQLRLNLFAIHESQPVLVDGVLTLFHESYSDKTDDFDAVKLHNSDENIAISVNDRVLAIERRNIAREYDTLFYHLVKMKPRTYQLQLIGDHLGHNGMEAFLKDNYLHTATLIPSTGATDITFSINADSASKAKDRFIVIFKPAANPVPVFFVSVNAWKYHNDIIIEWEIENEDNILQYEAERSTDGLYFSTIAVLPGQNHSKMTYNITDQNPVDGSLFYRIKSLGKDGKIIYSKVVKVHSEDVNPGINIYPNPVEHNMIRLYFSNMDKGKYSMKLFNSSGQLILSDGMYCKDKNDHHFIPLNKETPSGIYHLEITKPNGLKTILNLKK